MAERLPVGAAKSTKLSSLTSFNTNFASSGASFASADQLCSSIHINDPELNGSNGLMMSDGQNSIGCQSVIMPVVRNRGKLTDIDANHETTEWVEQDEPGVYITLTSLPGGVKDLKRVRFSRKRFSEKQAEQWWADNRARVYQHYNVHMVNKSTVGIPSG